MTSRTPSMSPLAFFVATSASEGFLGAYAPRNDILDAVPNVGGMPRYARHDRMEDVPRATLFGTPRGLLFLSPLGNRGMPLYRSSRQGRELY